MGVGGGGLDMVGEEDGCGAKPSKGEFEKVVRSKGQCSREKGDRGKWEGMRLGRSSR